VICDIAQGALAEIDVHTEGFQSPKIMPGAQHLHERLDEGPMGMVCIMLASSLWTTQQSSLFSMILRKRLCRHQNHVHVPAEVIIQHQLHKCMQSVGTSFPLGLHSSFA